MTLILTNLDFELTWARKSRDQHTLPALVLTLARQWQHILKLIAPNAHTLSLSSTLPDAAPPEDIAHKKLIPWGWTPHIVAFAEKARLQIQAPPLSTVELVNSKKFSHHLEKTSPWPLPGAAWIDDPQALLPAIKTIDGPWILKDPWGVSGRGQRRSQGNALSPALQKWALRLIKDHGGLLLEPRLEILREVSLHFDIKPDQQVHFIGACELITGKEGTLRALQAQKNLPLPQTIFDGAQKAAYAVAAKGYFGPLGIDAMIGRWKDTTILRPLTEINARWTFGRMALALLDRAPTPPAQAALRWRFPASSKQPPPLLPWPQSWTHGSFHLPKDVDPHGRSKSFVEFLTQPP